MSCERYADALLEMALGEPSPPELVGHLRSCAACREALQRERGLVGRIDGELRDAVSVSPSPELLRRVRARARGAAASGRPWRLFWLLPVAAGLVALVTAVSLRQPSGSQPTQAGNALPPAAPRVAESTRPIPEVSAGGAPAKPVAHRPQTQRTTAEPEILVPPGEEELVRRFAAALQARRVDASAVSGGDTQPRSPELAIPLLQEIAPIEVKPLTPVNSEGVDHE